tara:strand:- start:245 stop:3376 length:3132 start_codon:yes stop_codon:yes gene_type:complete
MATEKSIRYVLKMKDGTSAALGKVRKSVSATQRTMQGMSKSLSRMTIIGTGVSRMLRNIGGMGAKMVRGTVGEFMKFEKGMAEVGTITDLTTSEMKSLGTEVQAFSRKYAVDATEAAKALYMTISAGTDATNGGKEAFDVMGEALRFGKTALVDAATSVDLMTTVLNSYGLEASAAKDVSDLLFTTIKLGKTTGEELAGSLGRVTPIAAAAGVSLEDLSAATIMLTRSGLSTDEAMTSLRGLLVSIVKPTEQSREAVEKLNLSMFSEDVLRTKGGLFKILGELKENAGDSVGALASVIPNVRALTGALASAGQQKDLPEIMAAIEERSGALDIALGKMTNTFSFKMEQLAMKFSSLRSRFGEIVSQSAVLRAVINNLGETLEDTLDSFEDGNEATKTFGTLIDDIAAKMPVLVKGVGFMTASIIRLVGELQDLVNIRNPVQWLAQGLGDLWNAGVGLDSLLGSVLPRASGNFVSATEKAGEASRRLARSVTQSTDETVLSMERAIWQAKQSKISADALDAAWKNLSSNVRAMFSPAVNILVGAFRELTEANEASSRATAATVAGQVEAKRVAKNLVDEVAKLKRETFDYQKGLADIPSAYESWKRKAEDLRRSLHDSGATVAEQSIAWRSFRDAIKGAFEKSHDGKKLSDILVQVSSKIESAVVNSTKLSDALKKVGGRISGILALVGKQYDAEAALSNEARILNRLKEVEGETEAEILSLKERIRAEEEARGLAVSNGLPDVERYVELSMQNYDLSVLVNGEEERRVETIRERVAEEQRALEEYQKGIEAMASSTTDAFSGIFSQWMSGQADIRDGFESFGTQLREQLSSAFLEPLIGAESFMNSLFESLFDWATQLGTQLANTIKGWFTEKATQRALDATVGTATHVATAAATAAASLASVATIMPGLSAAATAALIATFGGAGAAAGLLPGLLASGAAQGAAFTALAEGGRVRRPTLALIGEAGEETVIPDTRTGRARDVLFDLASRRPELFAGLSGGGGQSRGASTINISVDGSGADGDLLAGRIADEVDRVLGRRVGR